MTQHFSDQDLIAFLSGELAMPQAEVLALALEQDLDLAQRLEKLDPMAQAVRDAFEPILALPVPAHLREAVLKRQAEASADNVVSFASAKMKREARQFRWPQYAAMAASLVVGLVLGMQSQFGAVIGLADNKEAMVIASADGPIISKQVAQLLSSQAGGVVQEIKGVGSARASISFRDTQNHFCRQFSIDSQSTATDGVACHNGGQWRVAAIGTRAVEGGEIRTASGDAAPAVLAAVDALIEGDPMDAAAEKAALKALQ